MGPKHKYLEAGRPAEKHALIQMKRLGVEGDGRCQMCIDVGDYLPAIALRTRKQSGKAAIASRELYGDVECGEQVRLMLFCDVCSDGSAEYLWLH